MNHITDLSSLPAPHEKRLALRVTKDALRQIRGGHPWVFGNSILKGDDGQPGDLAVIFDDNRKFAAIGLYDPASPMAVKLLHVGKPLSIDADFFVDRVAAAIDVRAPLMDGTETTGHRLIHGENDGLPGFVVDRYDTTLVIKLYSAAWFPHLMSLIDALQELGATPDAAVERIVLRLSRNVARGNCFGLNDGQTIFGSPPDTDIEFVENGLRFGADVVAGQKTGHFFDQRDNRLAVQHETKGDVLDVFSSTGGFSVYAAAGGAATVTSVDINQPSLDAAEANMSRNGLQEMVRHTTICGDAFSVLSDFASDGRKFDVVVIDPPSFAQKNSDIDAALHAYRRLTTRGLALVRNGGLFVQASCSSRVSTDEFYGAIHDAADQAGVQLLDQRRAGHALDHPIGFVYGGYLKALFARVQR